MIDLRSEGLQANTGARHPPATPYATTTPGESAVMFGVITDHSCPSANIFFFAGLVRSITTLPRL